jgi:hypothetical protein
VLPGGAGRPRQVGSRVAVVVVAVAADADADAFE